MRKTTSYISGLLFLLLTYLVSSCSLENIFDNTKTNPKQMETEIFAEDTLQPSTPPPTPENADYGQGYKAIQLSWFYKPPASNDLNSIAKNYSLIILTRADERARDALSSLDLKTPILQYLLFNEIQDPGSCQEVPFRNQVAFNVGDYCNISKNHTDWFMTDTANNSFAEDEDGYHVMDPGSTGWRSFWLERARYAQEKLGWQGVFLDNVEASLEERIKYEEIPGRYQDDASYQAAIEDNLRFLYEGYFKPEKHPLFANIISLEEPSIWFRYLQYLDGAMLENFAVDWRDNYLDVETWEMQMDIVEKTQALDKSVILVSQGDEFDSQRQLFSLASYLLVNNGKAYFRYVRSNSYDQNWLYDNYKLDIGRPLGPRYKEGNTWKREFEKGIVTVNPDFITSSITLK